ncbi:hypothetical protein HBH56_219980 [Parastagonospora nodorum]|uniref:Uncharacterized protein n=2 Tax=Phaeosphaeria nodorum (strain SN15 / ATCC MYA-4574 / FGSC 10173) TaxID=321614 RepID=A0A7U2F9K0_PHANO|nr:hypothetical protein HBH56_219980 [Parastagonospora nodorum]QRD01230.1 hypothetical protein JI435_157290 [Parastagonospora nodorum SN15]KAH3922055.1 hypothetical protein HBH54_230110 [Parastagonospora nodorum]KAH3958631.1 hypothetical protein HBH51_207250 [Parastagonospora nodorum]KAH4015198.1 hypothetical protein HBI09_207970 [Parastagonospora nodorum]
MAANGTLTPPSLPPAPASPSAAKRKHVATNSIVPNSALVSAQGQTTAKSMYTLQMVLDDMLSVLKSYDTQPSILSHPITSSITRSSSGEADSKRSKLTPPNSPTTIASQMQDGSYETLQALEHDIENVTTDILASSGGGDASHGSNSLQETALQAKVLAFRKVAKSLVEREEARKAVVHGQGAEASADQQMPKEDGTPVAIKEEEPQVPQSRTVLTLFGSANQVPKQLFSSLQQSRKIVPTGPAPTSVDTSVQITLPLRESSLPNIMSTTEVYPLPDQADTKEKKITTIGEVFRAPAHLPQISPPKAARPTTGKSHTITFAPPEMPKPSRKGSQSYAHQNLSAGFWLGYAGVDLPKDQSSPTAKQKSRQRALSMGEAQQPPSEASLVAVQQAKEDALFRSAYSSFAPTRDDSTAIIPEETKNRVWWQRVGEKRFNEMFPIDPALLDAEEAVEIEAINAADEEATFKDAVDNFEQVDIAILSVSEEKSDEEKGTDEVLQEISELLETLASHQRIRNSSLTTNPRTPVVQNSSLASLAGSPSTPSTEEFDVYQILKSQLTLLVSQLPPYAVAKLNGDQLDELNISRTILFDTKEYKGVLEEDALSRLAKAPPVAAATPATLHRTGSGTHAHYPAGSAQYSRPAASVHQSSTRPVQTTQSFYPQQQSLHRSSSMLSQRSPSGTSHSYQAGGASYAPSSRSYSNTQSYSQQTPRPSYGQTPSGQYYPQRSAQLSTYGGAAASQYQAPTPQTQPQNRYTAQPAQNGYMPRAQNSSLMYNGSQTPQVAGVSPLKATPAPALSAFNARPAYSTPVAGGQARSSYYGPSQYGTPQAPTPSTTFGGIPANPQQMMMDRQQAQAVAQSQARLAAQSSFSSSRAGSGTPQPPNGSYNGQSNGASMST